MQAPLDYSTQKDDNKHRSVKEFGRNARHIGHRKKIKTITIAIRHARLTTPVQRKVRIYVNRLNPKTQSCILIHRTFRGYENSRGMLVYWPILEECSRIFCRKREVDGGRKGDKCKKILRWALFYHQWHGTCRSQ